MSCLGPECECEHTAARQRKKYKLILKKKSGEELEQLARRVPDHARPEP